MATRPDTRAGRPGLPRDLLRILVMGGVLAGLVYVAFFHRPSGPVQDPTYVPIVVEPEVPVPQLDPAVLAEVKDDTREERLVLEARPLRHLLEKSLDIVPTVATALGMTDEPASVPRVRANKEKFRGRYIWFKGRLEHLAPPRSGHPVEGYSVHEAILRTEAGDPVIFAFSMAPDPDLKPGDWVRAEGFFLKLRDTAFPERIVEAPMLVGPRLYRDYRRWEPVTELDPKILDRVKDGLLLDDGDETPSFEETPDSKRILDEDQDIPLWHLASYAMHRRGKMTKAEWRKIQTINDKKTWFAIRNGKVEKGTPMRILGEFIQARTIQAQVNPIGVTHWTEVWVRVRDLGGKLIAVWVPDKIPPMSFGTGLEVRGYLYKRHTYVSRTGDKVITAVFVAPALDRYVMAVHPLAKTVGWIFGGLIAVIVIVFFFMARKDRRITERNEEAMIQRRRRRRQRTVAGSAS